MVGLLGNYAGIAPIYDSLGAVYSGGAIGRCKRAALATIRPGDRVLFAGCGTGREALLALQRGASVTLLDRSEPMLSRARRRCQRAGTGTATLECVQADLCDFAPSGTFDVVVANFFLNVFRAAEMPRVLARLIDLARPEGHVVIGDFAPPVGGRSARLAQSLHHGVPMAAFRFLTGSAWHEIYDYASVAHSLAVDVVREEDFRAFGGPAWYRSIVLAVATRQP